jgi:hypothetical protein
VWLTSGVGVQVLQLCWDRDVQLGETESLLYLARNGIAAEIVCDYQVSFPSEMHDIISEISWKRSNPEAALVKWHFLCWLSTRKHCGASLRSCHDGRVLTSNLKTIM